MQAFYLQQLVGATDVYLIDQIIKGRYKENETLLDAGCGNGRNLHWFLLNHLDCYGLDKDEAAIAELLIHYPSLPANRLYTGELENMPFDDNSFDHIISSAVLHFATSEQHFEAMLKAIVRVVKQGGSIFIRMTSDIGIEKKVNPLDEGRYELPDGSTRFLLTRQLLKKILENYPVEMMEPLKTVNVDDIRCMSTLIMQKKY